MRRARHLSLMITGLAVISLMSLSCGEGSPPEDGFAPQQITADEVRERLTSPLGGFEYAPQSFDFEVAPLGDEGRALAEGLDPGEPVPDAAAAARCESGLFHGRWKALDTEVGVVFGALRNRALDHVGHIAGIFGLGKLHGIITRSNGDPRFLFSGTYAHGSFTAELLGEHKQAIGTMRGIYLGKGANGFFVGFWQQRCAPPSPPPPSPCVTNTIDGICAPAEQLRERAAADCAQMGMHLSRFQLGSACVQADPCVTTAPRLPDIRDTDGSSDVRNIDGSLIPAPIDPSGPIPAPDFCWPSVAGYDGATYTCCSDGDIPPIPDPLHECFENEACGATDNYYCAKDSCDGPGYCEPRPELCEKSFRPICGCDGRTYGNRCMAAAEGVNVAHSGTCSDVAACEQPPGEVGPCDAAIRRWTYKRELGRCEYFTYGGCGGNDNNFETLEECERTCIASSPTCTSHRLGDTPGACISEQDWRAQAEEVCAAEGLRLADVTLLNPCPTFCVAPEDPTVGPCGPPIYGGVSFGCCKDPEPAFTKACFVGGCSGQLCSAHAGLSSTCEWLDQYACYRNATCGPYGPNGACAWKPTPELDACLADHR